MILFKRLKVRNLTKKLNAMQKNRVHNQVSDEILVKECAMYHQLAKLYGALQGCKKVPFAHEMVWECYRAAANLDDANAQYLLAKHLVEEGKLRQQLQKEGLFASPSNERRYKQLFEEAHAYLSAAETLRHIEAKRLRGLCYINGWGVDIEPEKGFELVVDSIDQENSWDRVPQIFASIGLNKPEFFAALTKRRKSL